MSLALSLTPQSSMAPSSTPLHDAIQNGDSVASIKQLLAEQRESSTISTSGLRSLGGGGVSSVEPQPGPDSRGAYPIHSLAGARACTKRTEVLDLLLEHYQALGFTKEQILLLRDRNGNTVYHLAAKYKRFFLVKKLIELGADPFATNKENWLPIHYAANVSGKLIKLLTNMMDHCPVLSGMAYADNVLTPVQVAAKHCALEPLKKFRERKYNFRPHGGQSVLNLVILSDAGDSEEAVKCIEYLLSIGAQHLRPTSAGKEPSSSLVWPSPIHLAAQKRFPRILECLLENQWNAMEELMLECSGAPARESPLHALARFGKKSSAECARILLDRFYHKDELENVIEFTEMVDAAGHTALDLCCVEGNALVAQVILTNTFDVGADVYWLRSGQTLHKIYGMVPSALVPVLDLSYEQQLYKNEDEGENGAEVVLDYSLITGAEEGGGEEETQVSSIEEWTESSHLHQIVEQDKPTQTQILRHPLVKRYLNEMWARFNLLSYIFATIQILILASYVFFVSACNCTAQDAPSPVNSTKNAAEEDLSCREAPICIVSLIITTTLVTSVFIKELFQLITSSKLRLYFKRYNVAQLSFTLLALCSVAMVLASQSSHILRLVSVFALVAVWFVAILQLQNLPPFGIYISIFGQVSRKSAKLLLIFGLPTFLIFSNIFRLLLRKGSWAGLGAYGVIVKLLVLTIGELTFDETFFDEEADSKSIPTQVNVETALALTVFAMFAFIATIVILNLLLAIAVDISQDVYSNAETELARCQLEQIYLWETLHPKLRSVCDAGAKRFHLV